MKRFPYAGIIRIRFRGKTHSPSAIWRRIHPARVNLSPVYPSPRNQFC